MWLTCYQPISALLLLQLPATNQKKDKLSFSFLGNRRLIERHAAMLPVLASPRHVRASSVTSHPVKQSSLCGKEQYNSEFGDRLIQIIPHSWHTCGSPFLERFLKLPQHFEGKKMLSIRLFFLVQLSIRLKTCRMTQICLSWWHAQTGKNFRLNRHEMHPMLKLSCMSLKVGWCSS